MEGTILWNKKYLKFPVLASCKTNCLSTDLFIMNAVFREAFLKFKDQGVFNKEAAYLSRFIYCLKRKLRHNKFVKVLQKINRALLRYLQIDLIKYFQIFLDMIPQESHETVYLPTRSMLLFLLIRLQGVAQLMIYIMKTSRIAAVLLNQYINVGYLWKILFLSLGVVSRIYYLSENLFTTCCSIYIKLRRFLEFLGNLNNHLLPLHCDLPKDLNNWLNDSNSITNSQNDSSSTWFSLINNFDSDKWFKELDNSKLNGNDKIHVNEDCGVLLESIECETKINADESCNNITSAINSLVDLKRFYFNFKQNPKKYTNNFKKIDKIQCNMLQNLMSKYIRKMDKNVDNSNKVLEYLVQAKILLQSL